MILLEVKNADGSNFATSLVQPEHVEDLIKDVGFWIRAMEQQVYGASIILTKVRSSDERKEPATSTKSDR